MTSKTSLPNVLQTFSINLTNLANAKSDFLSRYYTFQTKSSLEIRNFILYQKLGKGAFASVYLSVDKETKNKIYAMKILKKFRVIKEQQVDHVKSEKRLLNSVRSSFIIQLHNYFQDETNLYLALEYMPGGELFKFLRSRMYFNEETTKFYSMQIILAIDYLHQLDIIYRDIKPENVLIGSNGYLKLADFGFAKLLLENRTYTLCGTPEYLAPETIMNRGYGTAVDWWGVGVLIYELLAGHTPFYSPIIKNIYQKISINKYRFPPQFTFEAKSLVRRLLEPDISKRLGNLRNKGEDVKCHKWFTSNNSASWSSIYSQSQPLPKEIANQKIPIYPIFDESNISTLELENDENIVSKELFIDF